jgi:hypothetical protein
MKLNHSVGAPTNDSNHWKVGKIVTFTGLAVAALLLRTGDASAQEMSCGSIDTMTSSTPGEFLPGIGASSDGTMQAFASNSMAVATLDTGVASLPSVAGPVTATAHILVEQADVNTPYGGGDSVQMTLTLMNPSNIVGSNTVTIANNNNISDTGMEVNISCTFEQSGGPAFYDARIQLIANGGSIYNTANAVVKVLSVDFSLEGCSPLVFSNANPGFTGEPIGDWAFGSFKVQCPPGEPISGLSEDPTVAGNPGHSAICAAPANETAFPQVNCQAVPFDGVGGFAGDDRLTQDPTHTGPSWDWDVGNYKAECKLGQYVAGVSQTAGRPFQSTPDQVDGILCCQGNLRNVERNVACRTELMFNRNSQDFNGVDWAWGFDKGQCPNGWYAAGVSAVPGEGAIHELLCCPM